MHCCAIVCKWYGHMPGAHRVACRDIPREKKGGAVGLSCLKHPFTHGYSGVVEEWFGMTRFARPENGTKAEFG